MWAVGETFNGILGGTSNPQNRSFTFDDSSGDEGILVAPKGSESFVGSDTEVPLAFRLFSVSMTCDLLTAMSRIVVE